jgi:hypothetical protein
MGVGGDSHGRKEGTYFITVGFSVTGQTLIYLARFELPLRAFRYYPRAAGFLFTTNGRNLRIRVVILKTTTISFSQINFP